MIPESKNEKIAKCLENTCYYACILIDKVDSEDKVGCTDYYQKLKDSFSEFITVWEKENP